MALWGPSGAGKTFSAMKFAQDLPGPLAVIDTERSSAEKYADKFDFDVVEGRPSNDPRAFAEVIWWAAQNGYGTLLIDTLTPAWSGPGGATDLNDQIATQKHGGNTFRAWSETNAIIDVLLRALLEAPIHIIATVRAKQVYVMDESRGWQRQTALDPAQAGPRSGPAAEFRI
jgi:hypothetical protein